MSELDFEKVVMGPGGKNMSGRFGQVGVVGKKNEVAGKVVESEEVMVEGDHENASEEGVARKIAECWEQAAVVTGHLEPDLETVQMCVDERMRYFKMQLADVGLRVTFSVYRRVVVREVDWSKYNGHIREKRRMKGYSGCVVPGKFTPRGGEFREEEGAIF